MESEVDEASKKGRDVVEKIKKDVSYLKSMLVVQLCLKNVFLCYMFLLW